MWNTNRKLYVIYTITNDFEFWGSFKLSQTFLNLTPRKIQHSRILAQTHFIPTDVNFTLCIILTEMKNCSMLKATCHLSIDKQCPPPVHPTKVAAKNIISLITNVLFLMILHSSSFKYNCACTLDFISLFLPLQLATFACIYFPRNSLFPSLILNFNNYTVS